MSLSGLRPVPGDRLTFRLPPRFESVEGERRHRRVPAPHDQIVATGPGLFG
ncbi:hypothetical protein AB0F88_23400 [Streptosporangium sp. NPDC023963]|uniref:hypothetical protein n=1 Tax=Streptosporangium sp. NPDC023963 TaxID=3155608 RepID=UPI003448C197